MGGGIGTILLLTVAYAVLRFLWRVPFTESCHSRSYAWEHD